MAMYPLILICDDDPDIVAALDIYLRAEGYRTLLAKNGSVYTGCNIECATFTPTNCAERTALFKAVSEGVHEFAAVAVVGAKDGAPDDALVTSPCGVCRQMLYEFGGPDLRVIMAKSENDWREMTLGELLPLGFGPEKVL